MKETQKKVNLIVAKLGPVVDVVPVGGSFKESVQPVSEAVQHRIDEQRF